LSPVILSLWRSFPKSPPQPWEMSISFWS
jgi:hypothetical protein